MVDPVENFERITLLFRLASAAASGFSKVVHSTLNIRPSAPVKGCESGP
jgi:hypothetical protein